MVRNLNNSKNIQSLTMYLHSSGNHKFHLRVIHRYQCLQHPVLNGVLATSKIVNMRQFYKLIKTNTCINKIICIKKMTHVEILPRRWLFVPQIQPHQVHCHPNERHEYLTRVKIAYITNRLICVQYGKIKNEEQYSFNNVLT